MPVDALKVGMYVAELDRPWLETPFILQGFKIRNVDDIAEIAKHCQWVIVEGWEDAWQSAEERVVIEKPRINNLHYDNVTPLKKEMHEARNIHQQASSLTRSFMDDVKFGRGIDIEEVKTTVSACVKTILRNPDAMMWLQKVRNRDEYTAEHSLNVGLLAITFGRSLGFAEEDLNKLGIAGMLHDVGKMRTPDNILNKDSKLTREEFLVMMQHPTDGRDILLQHKNLFHGAVDVAHNHHESLDGTGYPRKIKASSITDFTRIVTICDVYDAITSNRVYKDGQSNLEAFRILYDQRGVRYDSRHVGEFIECMGLYPAGSVVELRSGEVGIVIDTNLRHRHLPKVLLVMDADKKLCGERILNLERLSKAENQAQLIKTVLPNGAHGIRVEKYIEKGLQLD